MKVTSLGQMIGILLLLKWTRMYWLLDTRIEDMRVVGTKESEAYCPLSLSRVLS